VDLNIVSVWLFALLGGAMSSLGAAQAVTGLPIYPLTSGRINWYLGSRINWSLGETKLLGLNGSIFWLALSVYALVGGLMAASNQTWWPFFITVMPLVLASMGFQTLLEQHHNRRWPFERQISHT
jgi:hypothetical protein